MAEFISKVREYFALAPVDSDDNRAYVDYDDGDYEPRDYDRYDSRGGRRAVDADYDDRDRGYRRDYEPDYDDRDSVPVRDGGRGRERYGDFRDGHDDRAVDNYVPGAPRTPRQPQVVRITLADFLQARQIGEAFREGNIVVYDISAMEKKDAQRVVDFSAGIQIALGASTKPLAPRVFALIPEDIELDDVQLERLRESVNN